jgi:hypothetical protein
MLNIAWAKPRESTYIDSNSTGGHGGSEGHMRHGRSEYFVGHVVINATAAASNSGGFGGGATEGQVVLHELGHVMGLGHVYDDQQIMFPTMRSSASAAMYAAGDYTGLTKLGRGAGCI